jgi:hypothetical protein
MIMETRNKVYTVKGVSSDRLITVAQLAMDRVLDKTKYEFVDALGTPHRTFKGRVKTKLWNPIVSIKGLLRVTAGEDQSAVNIDYDTKTNGWFWFTFLIGCFFWPLWLLMIWMWISQKKKTDAALISALDSIDYELMTTTNSGTGK